MSKIVRLQAENVKRLKAVRITPAGSVVRIQGNNAQGKTSVLDSIQLALGGKSMAPPKVIRDGEARGPEAETSAPSGFEPVEVAG